MPERANANSDASQVQAIGDITQPPIVAGDMPSATKPLAPNTDNGSSNNNPFAPFNPSLNEPLFRCPISTTSTSSLPNISTDFSAHASSPTEAIAFGSNLSHPPPSGVFQFPPSTELHTPTFSFGQRTPRDLEPASEPSLNGQGNPAAISSCAQGSSSSPSSAMSGFCSSGMSFGTNAKSFQFPPPVAQSSQAFSGFGPVFKCSTGATRSRDFGCSQPWNPLFETPTLSRSGPFSFNINSSAIPSGFSSPVNGFSQGQCGVVPSFAPTWSNPSPLNVKRCYCGKAAGIRFSNKTDGTLGLFYCCPDYNEEAIRNGTQNRNYCNYNEWSNGSSFVRRCYCGKVAVLQKSEKFDTRDKLFYSCPEYKEKDVITGRCNHYHCSYIEWSSPPMLL
uniref:Uncharacterized protein n=1 Tax=Anthurium amnicola TaxID=1678845 RepID=A0A1D1YJM2_9ARAE